MAGGVPAVLEQPGGLLARLPGYRVVRVRLLLGGLPLAPGLLGHAAEGDPAPPRAPPPACEHCHTIPYQKGVCCSNVGVRTECPKCTFMCAGGTVYVHRGGTVYVHRVGTVYVHRGGAVYVRRGGTVYVRRGHCLYAQGHSLYAQGALSMCAGGTEWNPPPSPLTITSFTPTYSINLYSQAYAQGG